MEREFEAGAAMPSLMAFSRFARAVFSATALLGAQTVFAQVPQMPVVTLSAGMHLVRAEVAFNTESRMQGLMFRKSLGPNQGMLFMFTEDERHCMWMKNTFVPLSVAFINAKGRIVSIHDMEPQAEASHCAKGPTRYALEMSRGWFKDKGIAAGAEIRGIEKAPPAQP